MVTRSGDSWVFTGTTQDEDLVDELRSRLDEHEDLTEATLVRRAVRDHLGVEGP